MRRGGVWRHSTLYATDGAAKNPRAEGDKFAEAGEGGGRREAAGTERRKAKGPRDGGPLGEEMVASQGLEPRTKGL